MPSMSKLVLATAITVVAMVLPAAAQAETPASAPVNLSLNIVTTVLILGVPISLAVMYALSRLIPQMRSGEFSLSKFEFDWRAELLNQRPKEEAKRRAAEMACRAEEEEHHAAADVMPVVGAGHSPQNNPLFLRQDSCVPLVEASQVDVYVPERASAKSETRK